MTSTTTFDRLQQQIDRESEAHLYKQVSDHLRERIRTGELAGGDTIPPQRKLSKILNVSEITVRRAIQELIKEGLLVSRAGSGTFVARASNRSRNESPLSVPTHTPIRMVLASLTDGNPFVSHFMRGVRQELGDGRPLHLIELPVDEDMRNETEETAAIHGTDGLIMMSPASMTLISLCQKHQRPYVLVHNDIADGKSMCLLVDYHTGILEAASHLLKTGRRRIALITASGRRFSTGRFLAAYRMALRFLGVEYDPSLVVMAGYSELSGYTATRDLLKSDHPPDAIIYASDFQAKGGFNAAIELGRKIPDDLAIVGTGNVLRPMELPLSLTSIDPHFATVGSLAVRALKRLIAGETIDTLREVVQPDLVLGDSA